MINSVHFLLGAMLPCSTPFCTSDLHTRLPANLFANLPNHQNICLCSYLPTYLPAKLPANLPIAFKRSCLPANLPNNFGVCLHICLITACASTYYLFSFQNAYKLTCLATRKPASLPNYRPYYCLPELLHTYLPSKLLIKLPTAKPE